METKKFFLFFIINVVLILISTAMHAQSVTTLSSPESGNQTHIAKDKVIFLPGYDYAAVAANSNIMEAYINPNTNGVVDYSALHSSTSIDNRTLNTSLAVGTMQGGHNVTPIGAASYSIPILAPAGTNNIAPSLAFTYNSNGGNSILGMGWNISGLSMITRVNKNLYNDGVVDRVEVNDSDKFALDGNRLIVTNNGTYGANLTEYGTERETFSQIISHTNNNIFGPQYFTVKMKSGLTYEYGNSSDSNFLDAHAHADGQRRVYWRVNKIKDCNGNYIEFKYKRIDDELLIDEVLYTGNSSANLLPYNKIKFYYELRTDKNTIYIAGTKLNSSHLLTHIEVTEENNEAVVSYDLKYGFDNIDSYLKEIIQYGGDGTQLNATQFKYGTHDLSVTDPQISILEDATADIISGDFNGDGKSDILAANYTIDNDVKFHEDFSVYLSNGSISGTGAFTNTVNKNLPCCYQFVSATGLKSPPVFLTSDFNGDGRDDLFLPNLSTYIGNGNSQMNEIRIYYPNAQATNFDIYSTYPIPTDYNIALAGENFVLTGDFDGDSQKDYFTILKSSTNNTTKVRFSSPSKNQLNIDVSAPGNNPYTDASIFAMAEELQVIDFDGDGKDDIFVKYQNNIYIYNYIPSGSGFETLLSRSPNWEEVYFGDFNGDRKTDFLAKKTSGNWETAISNDYNHHSQTDFITTPFVFELDPSNTFMHGIQVADFNGDGKSDICLLISGGRVDNNHVYYSKGSGFHFEGYELGALTGLDNRNIVKGDFNGDGNVDLVSKDINNNPLKTRIFNPFSKTHLLQKVSNGLNVPTEFEYLSLAQGINYTKGTDDSSPLIDVQIPLYVVDKVTIPNGIGGDNISTYTYSEAKLHLEGRGFLGFREMTVTNNVADLKNTTEYVFHLTFLAPSLWRQKQYISSTNALLSETENTNTFVDQGNKRYWIKPNIVTTINHIANYTTTINNGFDNTNGNLLTEIIDIDNGLEIINTTNSQFNSNCSWISNKPELTTTVTTRAGQQPYTTTIKRFYNGDGNLEKTIDYFGLPKALTTTYSNFNSFGNAQTITTLASGLTNRTATIAYDSKGRFTEQTTNSINQSETAKYDSRWGKPTETTLLDGLKTTFEYDGFGRLKKTTTPEGYTIVTDWHWEIETGTGTSTTTADNSVYYTHTQHPGAPDTKTWYDAFERPRKTETEGYNNQWINMVTSYDERGNVKTKTAPFYGTDSSPLTTYTYQDDTGSNPQYYNELKTISLPGVGTTTYNYSTNLGEATISTTNPANQVSSQTVDATGKVISTTDYGGTLTMEYYSHGNQKNTKLGTTILTSMDYDDYARQTTLIDKNAGTNTYIYNAFGELEYQKDAKNNESWSYYDQIGRLDYSTIPEGTIDYQYVTSGNGLGLLKKVINYNGNNTDYTYDILSRVEETNKTIDGILHTTTYGYDNFNNNTSISYPSGFTIKKQYDNNSYLNKVTNADNTITLFQTNAINSYGQYKQYTLGNGITSNKQYDAWGNPLTHTASNIPNLITTNFDLTTGNLSYRYGQRFETFTYDNLNRLETSSLSGSNTGTSYSNNGNIETKLGIGNYTYDPNKIYAVKSITNPSSIVSATQQEVVDYTSFQQPEKIKEGNYELNFTYGANFNRQKTVLKQNGNTVHTRYFLGNYEKNVKNGSTSHIHYITCGDGLNAIVVRQNGVDDYYYTYTDYLGSILTATDASGTVVAEQNFDAWGRKRNPSDWTYNNVPTTPDWLYRGYTGHEYLPEFDLINMNGRMYDPILGRMLSPDNLVPNPYNTQSYNRYSYAFNNPLKYTDPDGNNPLVVAGIAALVGGGYNVATNWNKFEGFGQGLQYFSAGAAAGVITTVNPQLGFLSLYGFNTAIDVGNGLLNDLSPVQTALHHGANLLNATGAGLAGAIGKSGANLLQKWGWTSYSSFVSISATELAASKIAGIAYSTTTTVERVAVEGLKREISKAAAVAGGKGYITQIIPVVNGKALNPLLSQGAKQAATHSSAKLGANLINSGITRAANTAAHHIVAGGSQNVNAQLSRQILKRAQIGIDDAANGVFLPQNLNFVQPPAATHSILHTNRYYLNVYSRLSNVPTSQVGNELLLIRNELLQGIFPF